MAPPFTYGRKVESEEKLNSLLMKVKEESEKDGLKLNIQKTKIIASDPITSWQIDGETVANFILRGSKITVREGNGNPLRYSYLENPVDGGAWLAAVHGVARSQTRLSDFIFTFMNWRRKWQPTPVFLPGESQGRGSLVGCRLWGCTESDTTEAA